MRSRSTPPGTRSLVWSGTGKVRIEIGPTEFRMLHFLMSKPEVAHTRLEIRNRVWGEDQAIDERTIDAHIKRLRTALAPTGMDSMIQTVRLVGYRLSRKPLTSDLTDAGILPRPRHRCRGLPAAGRSYLQPSESPR